MENRLTVRFGPAGNCEDFYEKGYKSTVQAPEYLEKMGLDAYEYSCGRGVLLKQETAEKIGRAAADHHVALSIHAPYFTNLCNPDPAKQDATVNYIRQAAQAICWMGGTRVIFHPGALMKSTREAAHERALALMHRVTDEVLSEFPEIVLCPETLGKRNQYGTLEEVLALCAPYGERVLPCIDFAHLHAAGCGCIRSRRDFAAMLDRAEEILGKARMQAFHIHFSSHRIYRRGRKAPPHVCRGRLRPGLCRACSGAGCAGNDAHRDLRIGGHAGGRCCANAENLPGLPSKKLNFGRVDPSQRYANVVK